MMVLRFLITRFLFLSVHREKEALPIFAMTHCFSMKRFILNG